MKKFTALLICLLAVVPAGCASPGTVRVELEKDMAVDVKQRQGLEVEIESNPTTGYSWDVVSSVNPGVLRQKREYRYIPDQRSGLVGAGGVQIFYFEAVKRGRAELTFEYRRPWEKGKEPNARRVIRVDVH